MCQVIPAGEQQRSPGYVRRGVPWLGCLVLPGQQRARSGARSAQASLLRDVDRPGGRARISADGEDIEAGPGDIAVVGPQTPHKFKNMGPGRLDIICIHASPRLIQEALE
jgi:hypothetical protein